MTRKRSVYAEPIGFLSSRGPASPYQVPPPAPYPPFARPHFIPNQTPFVHQGGMFPSIPPGIPPATQPVKPGIGGLLQNLLSGKSSVDIQSIMSNAQKIIGVVNQLGTVVRNMSPMLEVLKGLSEPDPLDDIKQQSSTVKRKRVRRTRYSRRKRAKARSPRKIRKRRSTS